MKKDFSMSSIFPVNPQAVYEAWMSSEGHTAMTGSKAKVKPVVGGKFSAWEGYISGITLELIPYERIVQEWRTTEFPKDSANSHVEITLEAVKKGTKLTLIHSGLPQGTADEYRKGWEDFYFKPMNEYFG